jgi:hypothetical protein
MGKERNSCLVIVIKLLAPMLSGSRGAALDLPEGLIHLVSFIRTIVFIKSRTALGLPLHPSLLLHKCGQAHPAALSTRPSLHPQQQLVLLPGSKQQEAAVNQVALAKHLRGSEPRTRVRVGVRGEG